MNRFYTMASKIVRISGENGVVVVPRNFAEDLLGRLKQPRPALEAYTKSVRRGEFSNAWVDEILDKSQCAFRD